jgi:hypothetical protein
MSKDRSPPSWQLERAAESRESRETDRDRVENEREREREKERSKKVEKVEKGSRPIKRVISLASALIFLVGLSVALGASRMLASETRRLIWMETV